MASKDDLPGLSDAELLAAFIDNVQARERIEHVGAHNRLMGHRGKIEAELKARSGGTLEPLRVLLDHPDLNVRHVAAIKFRTTDHPAFERTMRALAEREDEIGRDARRSLELDAFSQQVGYPEHETETPRAVGPFAGLVHWQSSNPPPAAMTRAEIEQMLADACRPIASIACCAWRAPPSACGRSVRLPTCRSTRRDWAVCRMPQRDGRGRWSAPSRCSFSARSIAPNCRACRVRRSYPAPACWCCSATTTQSWPAISLPETSRFFTGAISIASYPPFPPSR
jgi:Domain of unknown function (DUF2019)